MELSASFTGVRDGDEYLFDLIDSLGHVDFSSEVTAALPITDGALVVVDCIQVLGERNRPVLTVNKLERCFLELKLDGEVAYRNFQKVIEGTNDILATYKDELGDVQVYPEKGTVAFSAGLHGWAFTLSYFAKIHAINFKLDESEMITKLWGENYFDTATNEWTTKNTGLATCKRGFVQFCYDPIQQIIDVCMNDQKEELWPLLKEFSITLKPDEKDLSGEALVKCVMQTWLPASATILEMMVFHLPSETAQKNSAENFYKGPLYDDYASSLKKCDPEGPLMLYVYKMIPASDKGKFYAFGRVFSGEISAGMRVSIMWPNYIRGTKEDLYKKSVERLAILMGKKLESIEDVPCGNTVALVGLDQHITKNSSGDYSSGHDCGGRGGYGGGQGGGGVVCQGGCYQRGRGDGGYQGGGHFLVDVKNKYEDYYTTTVAFIMNSEIVMGTDGRMTRPPRKVPAWFTPIMEVVDEFTNKFFQISESIHVLTSGEDSAFIYFQLKELREKAKKERVEDDFEEVYKLFFDQMKAISSIPSMGLIFCNNNGGDCRIREFNSKTLDFTQDQPPIFKPASFLVSGSGELHALRYIAHTFEDVVENGAFSVHRITIIRMIRDSIFTSNEIPTSGPVCMIKVLTSKGLAEFENGQKTLTFVKPI